MDRRQFVISSALIAAVPIVAIEACGATATDSSVQTLTIKQIESRARKEGGTVVHYGSGEGAATALSTGFHEAYPWAHVEALVTTNSDITSRIVSEAEAHSSTADVITATPGIATALIKSKDLVADHLPNDHLAPKDFQDPSGYRHPLFQAPGIIVYNMDLVAEPPKDIYELAQPKWKGKLAMGLPGALGAATEFLAGQRQTWGDKKWMAWLQGLKDNDALITPSDTGAYEAVLAGERALGPDSVNDVLTQPSAAPTRADFYTNAPTSPNYLCRVRGGTHPYTAMLLINWATSPTGEKAMAKEGYTPILNIDVPTAVPNFVPKGYAFAPLSHYSNYLNNPDPYITTFNQLWPV